MPEDEIRMDEARAADAVDDVDMDDGKIFTRNCDCSEWNTVSHVLTFFSITRISIAQTRTSSAEEEALTLVATVPRPKVSKLVDSTLSMKQPIAVLVQSNVGCNTESI